MEEIIYEYKNINTLIESIKKGPILDNGELSLTEAAFKTTDNSIKIFTHTNEIEPPHFHVKIEGEQNRFSLEDCSLVDKKLNPKIKKFKNNIRKWYDDNRQDLIDFYYANLPDDAPPQAKVRIY